MDRTIRYIDDLKASYVFPIAGPPCFLDDDLWQFNDIHGDEGNIFPDQQVFIDHYEGLGYDNGVILLPGTVSELTTETCETTHPVADVRKFFENKEEHLREYQARQRPVIEAAKATWRHPEVDVLGEMKRRIEPLLEESVYLAKGVGGPIRFDLIGYDGESVESIVVDFPGKEVRAAADEKVRYRFRTERTLIESLLHSGEVDWVNSSSSPAGSRPPGSVSTTSSCTPSSSASPRSGSSTPKAGTPSSARTPRTSRSATGSYSGVART